MTSSGNRTRRNARQPLSLSLSLLRFISFSIDNFSLSRSTGVCSTNCWKETGRLVFPVSCNILYGRSHDLLLTEGVQNRKKKHETAIFSLSLSLLRFISFFIDNPPPPLSLFLYRFTGVCSNNCWKETERSHDLLLTEGVQNRKKKHEAAILSLSPQVYILLH